MPNRPVHVAAVDLGATSGRVILGSYDGRKLSLKEVHRFPNALRELGARLYWDLGGLFHEARVGLAKALQARPGLAACAVDTWGCDYALLDRRDCLVYPVHAYRDTRTVPFAEKLARRGIGKVYGLTGIANLSYNTSLQLAEAIQACPHLIDAAERCLQLPDYFNFLLSGAKANEISIMSTGQLVEIDGKGLSKETLAHFGIPERWFRKPRLAGRRLGPLRGVDGGQGVQVALCPGHDTACAYDAMPLAEGQRDLYISSGTWSLIGFESDVPISGKPGLENGVSNERTGLGRYRPIKNCLGLWLLERLLPQFSVRPKSAKDWKALVEAAQKKPMPEGLIDTTDRRFFNPADMRQEIDDHLKGNGLKPPQDLPGYLRLICESLGQGHADAAAALERLTGKPFSRILMVGGGSKNPILCQATATRSGKEVRSFSLEGAAVGNMASQLLALDAIPSLRAFRLQLGQQLRSAAYRA